LEKFEIVLRKIADNTISETVVAVIDSPDRQRIGQFCSKQMVFPGLTIFPNKGLVCRNGKEISLTPKEFHTLIFLAEHPQWTYTAKCIYEAVWHESGDLCGNSVSKIIGQLRRKLTPETPQGGYIHTIVGHGYRFEIPTSLSYQEEEI